MNTGAVGMILSGLAVLLSVVALAASRRQVSDSPVRDDGGEWRQVQSGLKKLESRLKALEVTTSGPTPSTPSHSDPQAPPPAKEAAAEDLSTLVSESLDKGLTASEKEKLLDRVRKQRTQKDLVRAMEARIASNPQDAKGHNLYARALIEQLMIEPSYAAKEELGGRSMAEYDKAIALDPRYWEPRFEKAESLTYYPESMGKTPEALREFEALLALQAGSNQDPRFARTYGHLGRMYVRIGKADRALKTVQEGARLFPDDEDLRSQLQMLQAK
jgi:tetratricopeptide (TPR) repeat protein